MHASTPPHASSAPADSADNDAPETPSTPTPSTSQPPPSTPVQTEPPTSSRKISVPVPREAVGFIIGKRGETVRNMMNKSRAHIAVDREDTNPDAFVRLFHIIGDPAAVSAARALIREKVAAVLYSRAPASQVHAAAVAPLSAGDPDTAIDDEPLSEPLEMWIPRGCVGMIIGHGGQVINEMQEKAGATIVVHNSQMDSTGSKLLTITGGEREKQHAKELIQNLLDRAGLRNRYSDQPLHPRDTHWGFVPPHPTHPWYFSHPNPQMSFDPRQMSPEFPPRYPAPVQWLNMMHMPHQHQGQPSAMPPAMAAPPRETAQPSHPQQPTTPTTPPSQHQPQQLPQHIQIHHHNQQRQQLQQMQHAQLPQQIQQAPQPAQPQQPILHQPGLAQQQQPQLLPGQMPPTPMVPNPHLNPHVGSLYPQQLSPSAQPPPWNTAPPYALAQPMSVPYERNVMSTQSMLIFTDTVSVPSSCVGIVIGRNGETIRDLQQRSGAHIKVTPDRDAKDDASHRITYISGTRATLDLARSLVNDIINEGITRSFRDGAEARSSSDHSGRVSHDEAHQAHESDKPPDEQPSQTATSRDEKQKAQKKEGEESETSSGEQHGRDQGNPAVDYKDNTLFPKLCATSGEEGAAPFDKSTVAVEAEKKKKSSKSETEKRTTQQDWKNDGGGESEQYQQSQSEDQEDQETEDYSEPYVGGRRVDRPVTSYPSSSISFEIKIPHAKVGVIIGKGGSTIKQLEKMSGARIVVSRKIDKSREDKPREVTITGPEMFVEKARRLILAKINPPAGDQGKNDDKEAGLDYIDFQEGVTLDDPAMNSLAMDLSNQSLSSQLPPPMVARSAAAPMSPIGVPHTNQYATYQRPLPFVGPMPPVTFPTVTHYQNLRPMVQRDVADYRALEAQGPPHGQFSPHFMGPQQFVEQMQIAPGYAFPPNPEGGEMLRGGYGEYRPDQFYGQAGNNFGSMGVDSARNMAMESGAQMFHPDVRQAFAGEEAVDPYQGEEYEQQGEPSSSAA